MTAPEDHFPPEDCAMPLDNAQKHFLRLTRQGMARDGDGWARVSPTFWTVIDTVPSDLVERELLENGWGRARLTARGEAVLDYL